MWPCINIFFLYLVVSVFVVCFFFFFFFKFILYFPSIVLLNISLTQIYWRKTDFQIFRWVYHRSIENLLFLTFIFLMKMFTNLTFNLPLNAVRSVLRSLLYYNVNECPRWNKGKTFLLRCTETTETETFCVNW